MKPDFYIGIIVGLFLAGAYSVIQPRVTEHNISVTFEKPFKSELSIEPVAMRALE